jgi:ABC-2 type transport system permease protein
MSPTLIAVRALIRKDVASFLHDRRAVIVTVVTPILIAAFFGYLFGGDNRDAARSKLPVAIVDQDASELSREVAAGLGSEASLELKPMPDAGAARALVGAGKVRAALVLPQGFGAGVARSLFGASDQPVVELLYDPSQSFARPIVEGLLTLHVMQAATRALFASNGSTTVVDTALARLREDTTGDPERKRDLRRMLEAVREFQSRQGGAPSGTGTSDSGGGLSVPFRLADVPVSAGPRYNGYAHSFAGMTVQFVLFLGIEAGVGILLQRQLGLWRRLRAAPLSRAVLLGARCAATTLISLGVIAVVYAVAWLVFGVRIEGSATGFVAVCVAFAVFTGAIGLFIAAVGRSVPATRGLATFVVLVLVMLGGAWVPSFVFPEWLRRVTSVVPTRWAVDGLDAMTWRGLPLEAALFPTAALLLAALLFGAVAVLRFDWDEA